MADTDVYRENQWIFEPQKICRRFKSNLERRREMHTVDNFFPHKGTRRAVAKTLILRYNLEKLSRCCCKMERTIW